MTDPLAPFENLEYIKARLQPDELWILKEMIHNPKPRTTREIYALSIERIFRYSTTGIYTQHWDELITEDPKGNPRDILEQKRILAEMERKGVGYTKCIVHMIMALKKKIKAPKKSYDRIEAALETLQFYGFVTKLPGSKPKAPNIWVLSAEFFKRFHDRFEKILRKEKPKHPRIIIDGQ